MQCNTNHFWVIVINVKIKKKSKNVALKILKIENAIKTHTFYIDLDSKIYLGPRDPIIESMSY